MNIGKIVIKLAKLAGFSFFISANAQNIMPHKDLVPKAMEKMGPRDLTSFALTSKENAEKVKNFKVARKLGPNVTFTCSRAKFNWEGMENKDWVWDGITIEAFQEGFDVACGLSRPNGRFPTGGARVYKMKEPPSGPYDVGQCQPVDPKFDHITCRERGCQFKVREVKLEEEFSIICFTEKKDSLPARPVPQ